MALIGLTGAGQKPARSANKRTGHRPLSNPATRPPTALPYQPLQGSRHKPNAKVRSTPSKGTYDLYQLVRQPHFNTAAALGQLTRAILTWRASLARLWNHRERAWWRRVHASQ